jgi:hypothetical protein
MDWLSGNGNLALYYVLYRIGSFLFEIVQSMQDYILSLVVPRFIQHINMNNYDGGDVDVDRILAYLAEETPYPVDREKSYAQFSSADEMTEVGPRYPVAPGRHILQYKSKYIFVNRKTQCAGKCMYLQDVDMYVISTDQTFFNDLRRDSCKRENAVRYVFVKLAKDTPMRNGRVEVQWIRSKKLPNITFRDAVISSENQRALETAMARFNNPSAREKLLKIPHRLTILLSGPPGFGKSTLITAIANEMNLGICATSLAQLSDAALPFLYDGVGKKNCLVFEDIDTMTVDREDLTPVHGISPASLRTTAVSLSAFLNLLDGTFAPENSVVIMTTNYPEKLDSALIRAERVHLHLKFGPVRDVYERWTERFYPGAGALEIEKIIAHAMKNSMSTAALQSIFRAYERVEDAAAAIVLQ